MEVYMNDEKTNDEVMEEIEKQFKDVTVTPLPYYMTEIMSFPQELEDRIQKMAFEHNCTTSMVIEHYLQDLLSDKIDISEITSERIESLKNEKPYLLVLKEGVPFGRFSFFKKDDNIKQRKEV